MTRVNYEKELKS